MEKTTKVVHYLEEKNCLATMKGIQRIELRKGAFFRVVWFFPLGGLALEHCNHMVFD